jgi:hypothetical protein
MLFNEPTSSLDPELIKEALYAMEEPAADGVTMICVGPVRPRARPRGAAHSASADGGLRFAQPAYGRTIRPNAANK